MRITLIYPPPWKLHRPGETPFPQGEGAPRQYDPHVIKSGDFLQAPFGLLSIAAQALAAGHHVSTLNLSNACWDDVERILQDHPAELFGLSAITANRRGVDLVSRLIRRLFPRAHITVGGPHVTAQPRETLAHYTAIDTIVTGEGESTFLELSDRLKTGATAAGLSGCVWREGPTIVTGSPRPPIGDLDRLISPVDFFNLRTLVTSRGCPGNCTFCSSRLMWGRQVRFHSAGYVLDMLARADQHHDQHTIAIKDDTFTAHRRRILKICRGIQAQRLKIAWSCEARADHLDEELLCVMRRAGCQRISLGVESGSPRILKNIRKGISLPTVLKATRMAQKYGIQVRYYLMVGNRGETWDTFQETLDFITTAGPNQYIFTQLHLYPGTEEFVLFCRQGTIDADIYFRHDGLHLTCFAGRRKDSERIGTYLRGREGIQNYRPFDYKACKRILARLPDLHWAHMDLAAAYIREKRFSPAERHLAQAVRKRFFFPGLILNAQACIAAGRGDRRTAEDYLHQAIEHYPHAVVIENMKRLSKGASGSGPTDAGPIELEPGLGVETSQPCRPPESPELSPIRRSAPAVHASTASDRSVRESPMDPFI
jgi:radical SAM superfamily enzyme YgiQ (UPF0313 family)